MEVFNLQFPLETKQKDEPNPACSPFGPMLLWMQSPTKAFLLPYPVREDFWKIICSIK